MLQGLEPSTSKAGESLVFICGAYERGQERYNKFVIYDRFPNLDSATDTGAFSRNASTIYPPFIEA